MEVSLHLPCKPYVAHYLRQNYGRAPRLGQATDEGRYFLYVLQRTEHKKDNRQAAYTDAVRIRISIDDMERHGAVLTPSAITDFNRYMESRIKQQFEVWMTAMCQWGYYKKAEAIRLWQQEFDFPEHVWPFESLKKHYDRHEADRDALKVA